MTTQKGRQSMKASENENLLLSLFRGKCGHTWVGATDGSYACPVCGVHDGDHNIASIKVIPVQVDDWGTVWGRLKYRAKSKS
jgi:hypothetical protein